jgi:FecR-like protein
MRRRRRKRLAAGMLLALALIVGGRRVWVGGRSPLGYAIDGAVAADGYIPRVQSQTATLRFTDGTQVDLEKGSRARVVSTSADGAALRLEDGRARFAVVHRRHARWSVEAGPFVVQVTGTTFDVVWSAGEGVLKVRLHNGVVSVLGPLTRGGVTLLPGQELVARPDEGVLQIERAPEGPVGGAGPPPVPARAPAAASASEAPGLEPPPPATPAPGVPSAPASLEHRLPAPARARVAPPASEPIGADWDRRIAAGDFEAIVRDTDRCGGDDCLRALPSARLGALGDAARYTGRRDLARRALLAQRARFSGTSAAEEAAFLLGRLAEDAHEPREEALRWYATYLEESPSGVFAAEALGRKLLLLSASSNREAMRDVARTYLERFPAGAYAARARALLEGAR